MTEQTPDVEPIEYPYPRREDETARRREYWRASIHADLEVIMHRANALGGRTPYPWGHFARLDQSYRGKP